MNPPFLEKFSRVEGTTRADILSYRKLKIAFFKVFIGVLLGANIQTDKQTDASFLDLSGVKLLFFEKFFLISNISGLAHLSLYKSLKSGQP